MNLLEYEGKTLLKAAGIAVPRARLISPRQQKSPLPTPFILKSQVPVGDRMRQGGIEIIKRPADFIRSKNKLFSHAIAGHLPQKLLAEELIPARDHYYVSLSFDTYHRAPVIALSAQGGTGITKAVTFPIDLAWPLEEFMIRDLMRKSHLPASRSVMKVIQQLWTLFVKEKLLVAEINPLFVLADETVIAGDAKIVRDDHIIQPNHRAYLEMAGDIAVIASGGGASMLNLDSLLRAGGRPANYVEYSGNPRGGVVAKLTKQVLQRKNLRGCWVVGGTANFTDIYETMKGFVAGLQAITPRPSYPIVIRRDGPRRAEAFDYLAQIQKRYGYNFHLFGPEMPMAQSAQLMVKLAYGDSRK